MQESGWGLLCSYDAVYDKSALRQIFQHKYLDWDWLGFSHIYQRHGADPLKSSKAQFVTILFYYFFFFSPSIYIHKLLTYIIEKEYYKRLRVRHSLRDFLLNKSLLKVDFGFLKKLILGHNFI